jgi:hypothetical protein
MTGKMLLYDWIPATLKGESGRTTTRAPSSTPEAACTRERSSLADDAPCALIPAGLRDMAKRMQRAWAELRLARNNDIASASNRKPFEFLIKCADLGHCILRRPRKPVLFGSRRPIPRTGDLIAL